MPDAVFAADLALYGPAAPRRSHSLAEAQAYCRHLARSHYENFSVASLLLPRGLRDPFYAIYAYCRWADDLADETGGGDRSLQLLDWWEAELEACYRGQATHPVFVALSAVIQRFAIPMEPFRDLLSAFRQDQRLTRYDTFAELLDYCRRSANPVGRLVLCLGGVLDEERAALADRVCTGLQLANFCQDVPSDYHRGRIYLPRETWREYGCDEATFAAGGPSPQLKRLLEHEVARAESYLLGGRPLVRLVPGRLRVDVALFVEGGLAILEGIRRRDYDVWSGRPKVSKLRKLGLLARAWWQTRGLDR